MSTPTRGGWGGRRARGHVRGRAGAPSTQPRWELELLSSPSRDDSSYRRHDQPSLLDPKTQEDYRQMIKEKIDKYTEMFPLSKSLEAPSARQKDMANNITIFFRRLREGITASTRSDDFAHEVYETSACWSIIFRDSAQATSVFSQLPQLAQKRRDNAGTTARPSDMQEPRSDTMLFLRLLHTLRTHLPAQTEFFKAVGSLPPHIKETPNVRYLQCIASAIRSSNYATLAKLTNVDSNDVLKNLTGKSGDAVRSRAVIHLIHSLQDAVREQIWAVLRSSYREVSSKPEVKTWLAKSLQLGEEKMPSGTELTGDGTRLDVWLSQKARGEEVIIKEDSKGWQFKKS